METRTPAEWVEYLSREHSPVTITEFMAGCLSRLLGASIEQAQAARHSEAMLGALDGFAEQIAAGSGIPYASSADVRAALAATRSEAASGEVRAALAQQRSEAAAALPGSERR